MKNRNKKIVFSGLVLLLIVMWSVKAVDANVPPMGHTCTMTYYANGDTKAACSGGGSDCNTLSDCAGCW